jgi:hypothetical protein
MINERVSKLEALAREGFLSAGNFTPLKGWQDEVIADIKRRKHAEKFNRSLLTRVLFQPRLVWRFAVASLAVSILICLTLYLALPDANSTNDSQISEVSFDNYDNYIEVIAQL